MASQLEFEGPVLEDLLERVREEVGPDARIVAANRVRRGGVGGFFAREAFEVLVEPPEDATLHDAPIQHLPAAAQTVDLGIAADTAVEVATIDMTAADNREPARRPRRGRASIPASSLLRTERPPTAVTPVRASNPAPDAEHTVTSARHATILELADAVSEFERNDVIDLIEERNVSTQSHDFAQVLDRFSKAIDATPEELEGDATPAHTPSARTPEIDIRETSAPVAPPRNEPAAATTEPVVEPETDLAPTVTTDAAAALTETCEASPRVRRSPKNVAAGAEVIDRYETRLSRMGVPTRLIPRGVAQPGLKGALVESLTRLPPAPGFSNALGTVIAVVGAGSAPVLLARELAADYSLDPDDVVLATREQLGFGIPAWLQMSDAATAQERRRSWRRRTRPTIVACSLPGDGLAWARAMLDELEPTITWAIVDAGTKREDILHRVEALGGVDVLALDNLDDTVSPATALELEIPVGRLELEHASPLTWTELLLERMQ